MTMKFYIDFVENGRLYMGCSVYRTREEAERDIPIIAMVFGHFSENARIRAEKG